MANKDLNLLLECKNIYVSFADKTILENISLKVHRGEVVTLIGPNGCGKTTLVKAILGLVSYKGAVETVDNLAIGYIPQKFAVDKAIPLTLRRFMRLQANSRKLRSREEVIEQAELFGIEHLLGHQVHDLSGGELQRVLLARALLGNPDILILDEPVQGMDIHGQAEFYAFIDRIRKQHSCGILMISHDLHMVMKNTDRVICINHHICCEGRPEDVSKHPEYKLLFDKKDSESLALYTHSHDHHHDLEGKPVK